MTVTTETLDVDALRATLRGTVLAAGDDGYESARRVWNAMIDRRPRLIVRSAGVADVIAAVNFARDNGLLFSIRGGAHNVTGSAVGDDGLMLDMSRDDGDSSRSRAAHGPCRAAAACGAIWTTRPRRSGWRSPAGRRLDTGIGGPHARRRRRLADALLRARPSTTFCPSTSSPPMAAC